MNSDLYDNMTDPKRREFAEAKFKHVIRAKNLKGFINADSLPRIVNRNDVLLNTVAAYQIMVNIEIAILDAGILYSDFAVIPSELESSWFFNVYFRKETDMALVQLMVLNK